jgi:hypothetical protein
LIETPPIVSDAVARPVTVPAVGELKVTRNWPDAFVVPLNGPAGVGVAPFALVSVTDTDSPAAGTNVPVPVSFDTVTVKVCGWPTSFVADGEMRIYASTQLLAASLHVEPVQPAVMLAAVEVARGSVPVVAANPMFEVACTVDVPVTAEVIVTVQVEVVTALG